MTFLPATTRAEVQEILDDCRAYDWDSNTAAKKIVAWLREQGFPKGSIKTGSFGGDVTPKQVEQFSQDLRAVFKWWKDRQGEWHDDDEVASDLGMLRDSAGARRRDLVKPEFGKYPFEHRRMPNGTKQHRMLPFNNSPQSS